MNHLRDGRVGGPAEFYGCPELPDYLTGMGVPNYLVTGMGVPNLLELPLEGLDENKYIYKTSK